MEEKKPFLTAFGGSFIFISLNRIKNTIFSRFHCLIYPFLMKSLFLTFFTLLLVQHIKNQKYETEQYYFFYPSHYELIENYNELVPFIVRAPFQDENDDFQENINLSVLTSNEGSLEDFDASYYPGMFARSKIIKHEKKNFNGIVGYELIGKTYQNNLEFIYIQRYFKRDQQVYLLTFTGEVSEFEFYEETVNQSLDSFKLK